MQSDSTIITIKDLDKRFAASEARTDSKFDQLITEMNRKFDLLFEIAHDIGLMKKDITILKTDMKEVKIDLRTIKKVLKPMNTELSNHDFRITRLESV